jgi:hypothetical protein
MSWWSKVAQNEKRGTRVRCGKGPVLCERNWPWVVSSEGCMQGSIVSRWEAINVLGDEGAMGADEDGRTGG